MQLDIPPEEVAKLTRHAQAAGFVDVEAYVSSFIVALAQSENGKDLLPPDPKELADSLAMLDQGMQEFESGGGLTAQESRRLAHEKLRARR